MSRRIFVHHYGALGDVLLSLPALAALRHEGDALHLCARPDVASLLLSAGVVEEVSDPGSSLFLPLFSGAIDRRLSSFLSGFDHAFVFTADVHSPLNEQIGKVVPITKTVQTIPPGDLCMHVSAFRLRQVTEGAISDGFELPRPVLSVPHEAKKRAEGLLAEAGYDFLRPLAAVHPGSGGLRKCWPFERYAELCMRLIQEEGFFIAVFAGPAEDRGLREDIRRLAEGLRGDIFAVFDTDLFKVSALLSLADVYAGNDSGVTHLAALTAGRTVAVFGPTDPVLWQPLGEPAVITAGLSCAPCEGLFPRDSLDTSRNDCGLRCLVELPVERVFGEMTRKALHTPSQVAMPNPLLLESDMGSQCLSSGLDP